MKSNKSKKHKILIANRGEIAIRIMQACRKLGLDFVALFTEPDRHSEHCVLGAGDRALRQRNAQGFGLGRPCQSARCCSPSSTRLMKLLMTL